MASRTAQSDFREQGPTLNDPRQRNKKAIFGIGIAEVVLGSLAIVLAIVTLFLRIESRYHWQFIPICLYYNRISTGIWCGLFAITMGSFGIVMRRKPTRVIYITNMAIAIFTAIVTLGGVVASGLSAGASVLCSYVLVGLHAVITLLCFVVFILSIVHASFCCGGACYKEELHPPNQVVFAKHQADVNHELPMYPGVQNAQETQHVYDNPMPIR